MSSPRSPQRAGSICGRSRSSRGARSRSAACGALTAAWDWPAVFWFRIPIALAALLLLRGLPAPPQRQAADRFDVPGGAALVLGLVTMLLTLNRLRELSAVGFALLSALSFAAFIVREKRAARPIIAVDVLKEPGFALLNLVSVLLNLAAFSGR